MPHACDVRTIFPMLCDDLPKLGRYTSILLSLRSLSPPNVFFTGIPFDYRAKRDCDDWSIEIGLAWDLFAAPDDMFENSDLS